MPHCVIEHSDRIDGNMLIEAVHKGALASELFEPTGSDIKVRATAFSNYKTGVVDLKFVHVTLKILSGRTSEQKEMLSNTVLDKLSDLSLTNCSISVEVQDIDRASYAKVIV